MAKFQPNCFTGCRLGVSNVPSTCPDFHFEKIVEKDFWRCITLDKIITDYNTKAVNVDAYQRRDNNGETAGKVESETRQQMNNSFQRLCSVRSFLLSRNMCNGQFSHRTSQVEPSPLLLDTFFKSSTLPWKNRQQTASWSFS